LPSAPVQADDKNAGTMPQGTRSGSQCRHDAPFRELVFQRF